VVRFLSDAWFKDVAAAAGHAPPAGEPVAMLQQIVTGGPDGEIRYHVIVSGGHAVLTPGSADAPDATFTEDYATAAAIARGELTTQAALLAGHILVAGNMATLSARQDDLAGLDPVPAAVRADTTY
jgi:putative sterol carrier protein